MDRTAVGQEEGKYSLDRAVRVSTSVESTRILKVPGRERSHTCVSEALRCYARSDEADSPRADGFLNRHDVARICATLDKDLDTFAELHELIANFSNTRE